MIDKLREILCTVPEIKEQLYDSDYDGEHHTMFDIEYPIKLHHLLWYCSVKDITFVLDNVFLCSIKVDRDRVNYDYTKDLQDQSPETIEAIVSFLQK